MSRGKFICLEGGDGSGKSYLAGKLTERLQPNVVGKRFPSDGHIGSLIRRGLMGEIEISQKSYLYLFSADGIQEDNHIQGLLTLGVHVICDRHPTLSGRVFQKLHHTAENIESVYDAASNDGISIPDKLFVLDVPTEVALARMASREKYKDVVFEKDDSEYVESIRKAYLCLAMSCGGTVLDGTKPVDELVTKVLTMSGIA